MHAPAAHTRLDLYFPNFDYLRGVLAITVMIAHDGLIPGASAGFAVDAFFALSGWLIGSILLKANPEDLPRFYFNRAVRIWVPYYIALALLLSASLLRDPVTTKWLEFAFYKASFVYNIFGPPQLAEYRYSMPLAATGNHFWSVNAEEQFYLLAPLLLVLVPTIGRSVWTWLLISALAWVFDIYASISFGVLAAVYLRNQPPTPSLRLAAAIVGCAGCAMIPANYAIAAPVAAIGIVLMLAGPGMPTRFGTIFGGMSYQLYLNHWIGVFVMNAALAPLGLRETILRKLLSAFFSIAMATLMYLMIDRQLLKQRAQLYSTHKGLLLTAIAYGMVGVGITVGAFLTITSH